MVYRYVGKFRRTLCNCDGQCHIPFYLNRRISKGKYSKADVQKWLQGKSVDFSPVETLSELREKVKLIMPKEKKYKLDEIAFQMGHEVVRLSPYHCQYNPIELIWGK